MKKKILSLFTAIAIALSVTTIAPAVSAAETVRRGDVNGDNYININDALEILKYLANMNSAIKPAGGEVNERAFQAAVSLTNGDKVRINDALEILKVLANMSSALAPPLHSPSFSLPAGWQYMTFEDGMYLASSEDGQSAISVITEPLAATVRTMSREMGYKFDAIGLTFGEFIALAETTPDAFLDVIIERALAEGDPEELGITSINRATLNGYYAVKMAIVSDGMDMTAYMVFAGNGVYMVTGAGDGIDSILQTFSTPYPPDYVRTWR